jgi:hypothetical protein
MGTRKRSLGEEHPDTPTSMANLASMYRNQGRWKEAEELHAKELKVCKRLLGEEHPDTLINMKQPCLHIEGTWPRCGSYQNNGEMFMYTPRQRSIYLDQAERSSGRWQLGAGESLRLLSRILLAAGEPSVMDGGGVSCQAYFVGFISIYLYVYHKLIAL